MHKKEYSIEIAGRTMTAEFNDWVNQANGSVLLRYGDSVVLATAVMGERESVQDYFPLSVEYEEKFYAAGAILGSQYLRRVAPCYPFLSVGVALYFASQGAGRMGMPLVAGIYASLLPALVAVLFAAVALRQWLRSGCGTGVIRQKPKPDSRDQMSLFYKLMRGE